MEVEGSDVIKVLLQFLHEQGLVRSARELQSESGVPLNTVNSRERLASDIRHGRWENVSSEAQHADNSFLVVFGSTGAHSAN